MAEAETRAMSLQPWHEEARTTARNQEEARRCLPRAAEEADPATTMALEFWRPGLWQNRFLLL